MTKENKSSIIKEEVKRKRGRPPTGIPPIQYTKVNIEIKTKNRLFKKKGDITATIFLDMLLDQYETF